MFRVHVSILVLLECKYELYKSYRKNKRFEVSILVLLECKYEYKLHLGIEAFLMRFNPCFIGM